MHITFLSVYSYEFILFHGMTMFIILMLSHTILKFGVWSPLIVFIFVFFTHGKRYFYKLFTKVTTSTLYNMCWMHLDSNACHIGSMSICALSFTDEFISQRSLLFCFRDSFFPSIFIYHVKNKIKLKSLKTF